jgi:hypothetical protein
MMRSNTGTRMMMTMKSPSALLFRFGVTMPLLWLVLVLVCGSKTCSAFSTRAQTRIAHVHVHPAAAVRVRFGCLPLRRSASAFLVNRPSLHRLLASPEDSSDTTSNNNNSNNSNNNNNNKASVRFSGVLVDNSDLDKDISAANTVDYLLSLVTSDVGSIVLGLAGLVLLLVGRLLLDNSNGSSLGTSSSGSAVNVNVESMGQETRSNLLAVFACGSVLLNGISKLDVTSALAQVVTLEGTELDEPLLLTSLTAKNTWPSVSVPWVLESLLTATPAKTAVLLQRKQSSDSWEVLALAGTVPDAWAVLPSTSSSTNNNNTPTAQPQPHMPSYTPIADRFKSGTNQETYLPTLQALPGKSEFTYLPENTQSVLLIPVLVSNGDSTSTATLTATTTTTTHTVLALGSNQARSFTPRNVAWSQAVAARLAAEMEQ